MLHICIARKKFFSIYNVFIGNKGFVMELFSMQFKDNPDNTCYVAIHDLKKIQRSHFVDKQDVVKVNIQDRFNQKTPEERKIQGSDTVAEYVNINSLEKKIVHSLILIFRKRKKHRKKNLKPIAGR
jgi:hypothetical protein